VPDEKKRQRKRSMSDSKRLDGRDGAISVQDVPIETQGAERERRDPDFSVATTAGQLRRGKVKGTGKVISWTGGRINEREREVRRTCN
jgi:hypothetical protein